MVRRRPSHEHCRRGRVRVALALGVIGLLLDSALLRAQPADAAARAVRAREAMQAQRFVEAAALYAELVRDVPDQPRLRLNLGIALHSAGRYDQAAAELERVVAEDASITPAWLMLGLTRLTLGAPERAVPALQRVVDRDPANVFAHVGLGEAYLQLGRFADAARRFERAAELDPKSSKAWLGVGRSHTALARLTFEELERTFPASAHWAALLARSRASQQQYRSAFHLYRQALARDPEMRGLHSALAEIYRRTGHDGWAAEEERREAAARPLDCTTERLACAFAAGEFRTLIENTAEARTPEALYWRSLAASELAREAFERLDAMPSSPESHTLRAEAFRIRRLYHLAIEELQRALSLAPGDRELRRQLAEAYWLNGDYEEARSRFESLHAETPESTAIAYALGDTLLQLQNPEAAVPVLVEVVERAPDHYEARVALARALVRMGEWPRAIPHLEATLDRDADGSLHLLLARAYAATGQEARGADMMRRAEDLRAAAGHRGAAQDGEITAP